MASLASVCAFALLMLFVSVAEAKFLDRFVGKAGAGGAQFSEPRGVAVNVSGSGLSDPGDIYVVEDANARVQVLAASGAFKRAFGSDVVIGGATGTGNTTNGSTSVTALKATGKAFAVGQTITGSGIQAGTTVTAVTTGASATLTLSKTATATASGVTLTVAEGSGNVPLNEQQTVTLGANTTGGSFTLTFPASQGFGAATTSAGALAWNAPPATVQTVLEGLAPIGVGNVLVTSPNPGGGSAVGGPYTIEFKGKFADTNVNQMTSSATGLTVSSGSKTAAVATSQPGSDVAEICTVAADCKAGLNSSLAGTFGDPMGVAINETGAGAADPGDVYVRDVRNARVQQFDAEGHFVRMWGWGVLNGADEFQVCDVVDLPCRAGLPGKKPNGASQPNIDPPGQFDDVTTSGNGNATGIAIDQVTGDVWAVDPGNSRFQRFAGDGDASGTDSPEAFGAPVTDAELVDSSDNLFGITAGPSGGTPTNGNAFHIAVGVDGIVYVGHSDASARIVRYDPDTGQFLRRLGGDSSNSGLPGKDGALAGLAIDPETGNLFLARGSSSLSKSTDSVQEFDLSAVGPGEALEPEDLVEVHAVGFGQGVSSRGIAVSPNAGSGGEIVISTDKNNLAVLDDDGASPVPVVQMLPPTDVGVTTATFHANIDPVLTADFPTRYRFEISKNGVSWSEAAPLENPDPLVGGDGFTHDPAISKAATGLEANTLYRVRIVTSRDLGAGTVASSELTFITDPAPPVPTTDGASHATDASVRLNGRVNPGGLATEYWFEWGHESYGNLAPIPNGKVPAGAFGVTVGETITGLAPESAYHFRLCARNSFDEQVYCGANRTFTTRKGSTGAPDNRSYEMVTDPDKVMRNGAAGQGGSQLIDIARSNWALPASDGSAVRWVLFPGATSSSAEHGFTWAQTPEDYSRTSTRWQSKAVTNISPPASGNGTFLEPVATAADLSTSAWTATTPFFSNFSSPQAALTGGSNQALKVAGDTGGPRGAGWYPWLDPAWFAASGAVDNTSWAALIDDEGDRLIGWSDAPQANQRFYEVTPADGGLAPRDFSPAPTAGPALFLSDADYGWRPGDVINECTGTVGGGATLLPEINNANTVSGPAGSYQFYASFLEGSTTVTVDLILFGTPSVGHTISGAGIQPGTKVVGTVGTEPTSVTIDKPTTAAAAPSSFTTLLSGGQDSAALADDTVAARPCEAGSPTDVRGAALQGSGVFGSSLVTAMSDDGKRVFFMSPSPNSASATCSGAGEGTACPPQLFVRQYADNGTSTVRWLSRAEDSLFSGPSGPQRPGAFGNGAVFEGASVDGDVVYFRTNAPLLEDDPNGNGGANLLTESSPLSWDLYRYELGGDNDSDPVQGDPGDRLTRVSGGADGTADPNTNCTNSAANCGGTANGGGTAVRYMSDDGKRVYFVTAAQIPGANNAVPAGGTTTPTAAGIKNNTSTRNLYLYDADKAGAAAYEFVATIPFSSGKDVDSCASTGSIQHGPDLFSEASRNEVIFKPGVNCVHGTTSGDAIVFRTTGKLTADDVDSAADIYLYEAAADQLTRISAPPPGVSPYACERARPNLPALMTCNADLGVGSKLFPIKAGEVGLSGLRHWNIAENPDGTLKAVYFESRLPLLPEDVDGAGPVSDTGGEGYMDVYEWRQGRLSLITTDDSPHSAFYSGNARDGSHVFFWTEERISPWEIDESDGDLYNATTATPFPDPPDPPAACDVLGGACQGPAPTAPATSAASTVAINGQGNFIEPGQRTCPRNQVRSGSRCVAKRTLAKRACAKRKGKTKRRCVANQMGRLNRLQQSQNRTNADRRASR